ncbi:MAG: cytidine deaminase [Candidatus Thermofonsia Clade 1 bacterium]|jgi:cytidine deaminase|uniref:Cytidine deaminase n=1 Tax=Candidatus Thermofonsia Clade 1 bacterium TaxID=2364210 RepID=A0A2M8PD80_9CHLR|nr:MAG: cytidine deaminase [Candidatus Thermofonsia Clade 1 bacterium]RMF53351.1 MAG: cytidine deaminase [Chloroflexota bacterium]
MLAPEVRAALIRLALEMRERAYCPYSRYQVGAALLAEDGALYGGCNVENASYGGTICAERTALVKAVSEGARRFSALAVATVNGGSPCGICRQFLYEFAPNLHILLVDSAGIVRAEYSLRELLPHGFGATFLE